MPFLLLLCRLFKVNEVQIACCFVAALGYRPNYYNSAINHQV